jgi:hypothetical protein
LLAGDPEIVEGVVVEADCCSEDEDGEDDGGD